MNCQVPSYPRSHQQPARLRRSHPTPQLRSATGCPPGQPACSRNRGINSLAEDALHPAPQRKGTKLSPPLVCIQLHPTPPQDAQDGGSAIPAMLPSDLAATAGVAATSPHAQPPAPRSLKAPLQPPHSLPHLLAQGEAARPSCEVPGGRNNVHLGFRLRIPDGCWEHPRCAGGPGQEAHLLNTTVRI